MSGIWLLSYLMLWAFVTIEGVIIIALLRVFTGLHQRIEEHQESQGLVRLTPGDVLIDQDLIGLSGDTIQLSQMWQQGHLLLLFTSSDCAACWRLLTWVRDAFRNGQFTDWDVCILCAGRETQFRKRFGEIGFPLEIPAAVIDPTSLRWRYHVPGTPTIAIVEENGRIVDVVTVEAETYLEILTRRSAFQLAV